MTTTPPMTNLSPPRKVGSVNEHYRKLAFELDDGDKGNFLSGWQSENPFAAPLLKAVRERCGAVDYSRYTYFDADDRLTETVLAFHDRVDNVRPQAALNGAGASPLISSFIAYLAKLKIRRAYFIPPVYHTIPVALDRYEIEFKPVSTLQPYEHGFGISLPDVEGAVLFLTDPTWYAGTALCGSVIQEIANWQRATKSLVFVDGSLQYLAWDGGMNEATSRLSSDLTFRVVSPSKQLAIHGYRFAYLLCPETAYSDLTWIYANICGPASAESIEFAHEAMAAVSERSIPLSLLSLADSRFRRLTADGKLSADPTPDRAYSVFGKVHVRLPPDYAVLDGRFFDQSGYPSSIKVNLLSPSIDLLLNS